LQSLLVSEQLACRPAAGEGERVSFGKNTVKARNNVESWLGSVESAMVSSLRRLAKQGMASYPEEPRPEWVLQQPAQLVIAVSQVFWCAAVEEALQSDTPVQKLADVHEVCAVSVQRCCWQDSMPCFC
jgi:dynein heavy chain